jgi:hypothetical protein
MATQGKIKPSNTTENSNADPTRFLHRFLWAPFELVYFFQNVATYFIPQGHHQWGLAGFLALVLSP